jgi:nucleoside-diphosphate-sugar epimerase
MNEIVSTLSHVLGEKLKVRFMPLPSDDPQRRRPDCTRAKERLRWSPKVELGRGLESTVAYFRERMGRR